MSFQNLAPCLSQVEAALNKCLAALNAEHPVSVSALSETLGHCANALLQASISRFKGKDRFDLRMYYRGDCAEWLPTQKGVAIDMEQVPLLIEALQNVLAQQEATL